MIQNTSGLIFLCIKSRELFFLFMVLFFSSFAVATEQVKQEEKLGKVSVMALSGMDNLAVVMLSDGALVNWAVGDSLPDLKVDITRIDERKIILQSYAETQSVFWLYKSENGEPSRVKVIQQFPPKEQINQPQMVRSSKEG